MARHGHFTNGSFEERPKLSRFLRASSSPFRYQPLKPREIMTARELHTLLQSERPPQLLQVLPVDIHAATHLPNARNACVYETSFLDQVRALGIDPSAPLVVYGAGEGSLDAATALEQLRAAGYTEVRCFEGGLAEWKAAGFPLEGSGLLPPPPVPDGIYTVDADQSVIRWTGRNLFNHHSGTVHLGGGEIVLNQGTLVSARFTIDMTSIANEDISDSAMNAMLLAHLRTADFFDVGQHPTAEFVAGTAEKIPNSTDGTPNHFVRGNFTLRGIRRPLEFPVLIATTADARRLTGQGQFELDRTEFGSHYGSGKLFRFLGQHLVTDHIHLHVKIHADRQN